MKRVTTYHAREDVWDLSGNWTRGTVDTDGTIGSLITSNQWDSATLREAFPWRKYLFQTSVGCQHLLVIP